MPNPELRYLRSYKFRKIETEDVELENDDEVEEILED